MGGIQQDPGQNPGDVEENVHEGDLKLRLWEEYYW